MCADLREEAQAGGHGPLWLAWHAGRTGLRLRWTLCSDLVASDLGYALRSPRLNGGFTVAAVVLLALGLGANGARFSLIDALMLRPLPVEQPDTLVRLSDAGRDTLRRASWCRQRARS